MGFVVRNDVGEVMISGSKRQRRGGSSTLIEALALLFSLNIVRDSGIRGIVAESDSELLIKAINREIEEEPYVMQTIEDIRILAQQVNCHKFLFVKRSANCVAHSLAHFGNDVDFEQIWMEDIPPHCNSPLQEDVRHLPTDPM